jgi:hypothetical protein
MEKFDSFYLCRISRKENNLIQTPVYRFVIPYLFYTYTFILLRLPCNENTQIFQENELKLSIFHAKKVVLETLEIFKFIYINKKEYVSRR